MHVQSCCFVLISNLLFFFAVLVALAVVVEAPYNLTRSLCSSTHPIK